MFKNTTGAEASGRRTGRDVWARAIARVLFVALTTFAQSVGAAETPHDRPNVLFIAVDDMNDWIGPLGGLEIAKTPNLDRLAKESTLFANAHCASPACASSRLAIMTGVQPSKTGVMKNTWYDGPQWRKIPRLKNIETIEQFFKKRGYETLAGGKIYHSLAPPWLTTNQADPTGWDFYFPSVSIPIPYQIRAEQAVINPPQFQGKRHPWFTWGPMKVQDAKMADHQTVSWASYELNRPRVKPLYLACGIFRPHMPWEVPQKYFDLYPLDEIPDLRIEEDDLRDAYVHTRRHWHEFVLRNKQWQKVTQAYLASISFADAQVGRLLAALSSSPKADNTIVVLWSDHGMHIGEKENWEKFTLWEESTRVPLFVKLPARLRVKLDIGDAPAVCREPVSLLDVYPTLAELAGFTPPKHCDGVSVVPLLQDPTKTRQHASLTSYMFDERRKVVGHSLRGKRYRYIYYTHNSLEELYDHQADPNEFTNRAYDPDMAKIVARFRTELAQRVEKLTTEQMAQDPQGYDIRAGRPVAKAFVPLRKLSQQ